MKRKVQAALAAAAMLLTAGSAVAAPTNDDIASATAIPSVPYADVVSTAGAGREPDEPRPCSGIGSTVWYRYTATSYGSLIAHTLGSDYDTALAVYSGSLFDLSAIECSSDAVGRNARVELFTHPGQTLYFQAGGENGSQGTLAFSLARPAALEGRVTDAVDGDGLAEICVDVYTLEHTWVGTGSTDESGDYHISDLPEGTVKVRFTDCLEGTYAREWYSDQTAFATADPVLLVADATTGAVDAALGLRPGPDLAITDVTVEDVPLDVAGNDVPVPATYNRNVVVSTANLGPLKGTRVFVHAEVCPRSIGSCKNLGDVRLGRVEPGQDDTVVFDWNGIDTVGDVILFVSVSGTRDMNWDDNAVELDESVWVGGTGFGARLCRVPLTESVPCLN